MKHSLVQHSEVNWDFLEEVHEGASHAPLRLPVPLCGPETKWGPFKRRLYCEPERQAVGEITRTFPAMLFSEELHGDVNVEDALIDAIDSRRAEPPDTQPLAREWALGEQEDAEDHAAVNAAYDAVTYDDRHLDAAELADGSLEPPPISHRRRRVDAPKPIPPVRESIRLLGDMAKKIASG